MKNKILKSLLANIVLMNILPLNAFAVNNVDLTYDVAEEEGSAIFHLDTSAMNFTNDALTKDINYHITVTGGNYYANNTDVKASPYLIEATESELIGEHNKNNKISVSFDYTNSKEIIDLTKDATKENTPYRGSLQASIAKVEKADSYVGKTTILFSEGSNIADGDYTEGPFTYSIKNNEATMTWYNANEGGTDVVIPRKTNLGAPVTAIGDYAFAYSGDKLTSVEIPNSVTSIGNSAFANNSLTSVVIPDSVTSIGEYAFADNDLTSVEIPNSVTSIGTDAFDSDVTILFNGSLNIADGNYTEGPFTYSITNNEATVTGYNVRTGGTDVIIPKKTNLEAPVTKIGDYVFVGNDLTSVEIPNSVTSIGAAAFRNNGLTSIEIPNSVTSIGDSAFASNHLTSAVIPNSVTSIGAWAFDNNSLTSIEIPNSVTSIGNQAFANNSLISVVIPNSVTSIGNYTFTYNSLTSVEIPNSVTSIGSYAFAENNSLTSVKISNSVTSIGNYAFMNDSLTSVVIPDSVTSIGDSAFKGNNLISVVIPNSVTSIGNDAFYGNKLTSVEIPDSVTSIGTDAFDDGVTIIRK